MTFTASEKAAEARREIAQRLRVYGRLVSENRMTARKADRAIALMKEIAEDYDRLAEAEQAKERLL